MQEYLECCIKSVLAQTYRNLQIILVNDGSTDNSAVICQKFAENDSRIEVINKENGGLSDARNAGIEKAKGIYLSFVDSDDFVHERFIEIMYNYIKQDSADMCICGFTFVDENNLKYPEMTLGMPSSFPDFAGLASGAHSPKTVMKTITATPLVVAWNKLYCRELFYSIRFPDGRIHEDEFILHHLIDACDFVSVTSEQLYYYLQRDSSIMGARFAVRRLDVLDAYDERMRFYLGNKTYELIKCTCLGYIRRYVEACCKLPADNPENVSRLKECRRVFLSYRAVAFKYGGFSMGVRYLLAAVIPKGYHAASGFVHSFKIGGRNQ